MSTLAQLARTCTAFSETALDSLWYDQDTLAPLMQVLPEDLWEAESDCWAILRTGKIWKIFVFTRQPNKSDWQRFDYYAQKIRRIGYTSRTRPTDMIRAEEAVISSLCAHRPTQPLLPNLRGLYHDYRCSLITNAISFVYAILGPQVTQLSLSLCDFRVPLNELLGLLLSVAYLCPQLCFLTLDSLPVKQETTPQFTLAVERLVCSLHHLQSITLHTTFLSTSGIIHYLGNLRGLSHCEMIKIPSKMASHQVRDLFATENGRFPKLRYFEFEAENLHQASNVIESLQCPLQHLAMEIEEGKLSTNPFSSLARFMSSFANHCCISSLTYLELFGSLELADTPTPASFCDAFRPLFSLKVLRKLVIRFIGVHHLDDDWFADAARAWPHLEALKLSQEGCPQRTLAGLIPLIRYCPRLNDVSFSVSAKPFDAELLQPGDCNLTITTLELGESPIDGPEDVFRCLVRMFPNLESIDCDGYGSFEEDDAWERVSSLLAERVSGQHRMRVI